MKHSSSLATCSHDDGNGFSATASSIHSATLRSTPPAAHIVWLLNVIGGDRQYAVSAHSCQAKAGREKDLGILISRDDGELQWVIWPSGCCAVSAVRG